MNAGSRISAMLTHTLAWLIIFAIPVVLRAASEEPLTVNYFLRPSYWLYHICIVVLFYFNAFFLVPSVLYKKGTFLYILSALGSILAASLLVAASSIFFPYRKMNMGVHYHYTGWIFFGTFFPALLVCAVSTSYRIIMDRSRTEQLLKERENEHLKSELTFLRSQVSPHFMFNVLNNIVSLSRKKPEMVEPVVIKLSHLMRYMLYESGEDKVTLEKETEYLRSYIDLQLLRFGGDVKVNTEISNNNPSAFIEPMLLIPFVENAFKHGVALIDNPQIDIRLQTGKDKLFFLVKNKFNDITYEEKDKSSGIGLNNVKRRLNLLYGNKHKLVINQDKGWFVAELTIRLG